MNEENYKVRHNVMNITSLSAFTNIIGGLNGNCKDVYFVRALGVNGAYLKEIENMDRLLSERMFSGFSRYNRIEALPPLDSQTDIEYYSNCYAEWNRNGRKTMAVKSTMDNEMLKEIAGSACDTLCRLFRSRFPNVTDTIEKNLVVKLLFWYDRVCGDLIRGWNPRMSVKLAVKDIVKKQEYLFCYFLTLTGIDVLLLQGSGDINSQLEELCLSGKFILGSYEHVATEPFHAEKYKKTEREPYKKEPYKKAKPEDQEKTKPEVLEIPPKQRGKIDLSRVERPSQPGRNVRREKEFEELALLASSVVMIAIHDNKGGIIGTGSGIMVGRQGYILTNNHVASGGRFYSVRIEDDEQIYKTDEVIKYNSVLDLAVIRIDRQLKPIPVYKGREKLVRGQKVVAIGSPLGLFNSVSNGIISGFRTIDNVDMIQFTAPISHGSSGGAVLNMYGDVIGISTAGIDSGQNINLAVGYESIHNFIRGFE
ncbi:trypsin-like serine protease [Clostridium sp. MCC353]|uniref:trypsin-like peptidase domain-containing protein n=1 Tax=Clostridium sp. MCC353 TaxID=2592646 RepID=UPI001C0114B0|nr:trypsin-like peptidase domain-containing protein [Clostridium sp. MCC353]MBT9775955.1 trypsin-like serine protease [Clostridium sp. MCC353]